MQGLITRVVIIECMQRYGGCACFLQQEEPGQVPYERCRQQARVAAAALTVAWNEFNGFMTALKAGPGPAYDVAYKKAQDWLDANRPQEVADGLLPTASR